MDKLESIDNELNEIREKLDFISVEISGSDLKYSSAHIECIGEVLTLISKIQHSIYEERPDLMPGFLKEKIPHPDINRQFRLILMENSNLLAENNPKKAIKLLKDFINLKPPNNYELMAISEVERIKKLFNL